MTPYHPSEIRYDAMHYRRCGRSGLKLPALSLDLWYNFGDLDPLENGRSMMRRAFDLGITHFDLANNYGPPPGSAEETFGRIFAQGSKPYCDELIISQIAQDFGESGDTLSLSSCRRCADAGYFIGSAPIATLNAGATFMTVGQAPGRHEAEVTGLPFSGPAGRRLFRWLAQAGFNEAEFRATQAMTAITLCYPGPHPAGRGDRVPTRAEQTLCVPWLEAALALIQPKVLIPIGGLAIGRFLPPSSVMLSGSTAQPAIQQIASEASGTRSFAGDSPQRTSRGQPAKDNRRKPPTMTDLIGGRFERDGRIIVPLPHPSGASQWFNVPENKARLAQALEILAELREELLST